MGQSRSALIFGARNLGRAIIETLVAEGWSVAGAARSDATLAGVTDAGALALRADVTDQASVRATRRGGRAAHGAVDLVVNAAAAYGGTRTGPFGGGPIAEAAPDAFDAGRWRPRARRSRSCRARAARSRRSTGPATLIQVTGGSSRRAMPGRGLWAAGAFGVRAITQAAALELRERGIHVALLIVDAGIEPLRRRRPAGRRSRGAGRPAAGRRRRRVPRRAGRARGDARAAGHAARRDLGAVTRSG